MLTLLATTTPIFIIMLLGFISVRVNLVPSSNISGISKIVLYFTLPALIFSTLARMEFHQTIVPSYLIAYAVGSLLSFAGVILFSFFVMKRSLMESAIKAAGACSSNSAYFAYPMMLLVFSHPPTAAFAMSLIIENILMQPLIFLFLELSSSENKGLKPAKMVLSIGKRLIKNPLIISVTAGVIASTFHITMPAVIDRVLVMLSGASATLALFVLGGSLVGASVRGSSADLGLVTFGKLVFHPAMVALAVFLMPNMATDLRLGAILIAAVPMMSIYPIIGERYGYRSFCASALLVTTTTSFVTLIAILSLIHPQ